MFEVCVWVLGILQSSDQLGAVFWITYCFSWTKLPISKQKIPMFKLFLNMSTGTKMNISVIAELTAFCLLLRTLLHLGIAFIKTERKTKETYYTNIVD